MTEPLAVLRRGLPPIWGYFSLRWLGNRGYV
jgi:hypothetical protein